MAWKSNTASRHPGEGASSPARRLRNFSSCPPADVPHRLKGVVSARIGCRGLPLVDKAVLPAAVPHLSYADLDEVVDGLAAQRAFLEAVDPGTSADRRQALHEKLTAYCRLDTLALVELLAAPVCRAECGARAGLTGATQ